MVCSEYDLLDLTRFTVSSV